LGQGLQMDFISQIHSDWFYHSDQKLIQAGCLWLMPVILATWEAENGRIKVRGQSRQTVCKTPHLQNNQSKMHGAVTQVVDRVPSLQAQSPEFKPQSNNNNKKPHLI
jgi:hypothetical protein